MKDYELVRVSREMVEQLINDESDPVVVVRLERMDDETCEMWLRTPDPPAPRPTKETRHERRRDGVPRKQP
jgi:hypothetical protein